MGDRISTEPSNVLPYEPPQAPRPVFSVPAFVATASLVVVMTGVFVFAIPKFEQLFLDFKMALPGITMFVLRTARWFNRDFGWFYLWIVPVMLGFVAPLFSRNRLPDAPPRRPPVVFWMRFAVIAIFLFLLFCIFGIGVPLISLVSSVKGS